MMNKVPMMVAQVLLLAVVASAAASNSTSSEVNAKDFTYTQTIGMNGQRLLNLTAFTKEMFWDEPPEGLYEVDVGLYNETIGSGHLMAFADLNADKYTDIITVNEQGTAFMLHIFNQRKARFDIESAPITPTNCDQITNIVVGRTQELLRLFITCEFKDTTVIKFFDKTYDLEFDEVKDLQITIERNSQPFIADLNGDFLEDILYTDPSSKNIKVAYQMPGSPLALQTHDFNETMLVTDETEGCMSKQLKNKRLTTPHSTSLIDLDGDCISDLFVTVEDQDTKKKYYEIYLRRERRNSWEEPEDLSPVPIPEKKLKGTNSYCLIAREEIPEGTQNLFSFTDVDRDGMIDLAYLTQKTVGSSVEMNLNVHYNRLLNQKVAEEQQKSTAFGVKNVCASTVRPINLIKDIFMPPSAVQALLDQAADTPVQTSYFVRVPIASGDSGVKGLSSFDESKQHIPGRMHFGDISSDGYPDIMLTLSYTNGTSETQILLNVPCDKSCSAKALKAKRRLFISTKAGIQKDASGENQSEKFITNFAAESQGYDKSTDYGLLLEGYRHVQYAAFFDLMENSMYDILLVSKVKSGNGLRISAIFNNIDRTAFFLKARMQSDVTVGTVVSGASFRAVLTDLNDGKFIAVAGSSGQTAYQSLLTPFSHIGIGRSNNFVEQFTVAVYCEGTRQLRQWSPIIPKSNLYVEADLNDDSSLWKLNLLVKPTEKVPLILIADGIFLLVLGLIIIVLHLYEKAEDKKENERNTAFNYF